MSEKNTTYTIDGYDIILTCMSFPEEYDVFKDGKKVGYLRLNTCFTVYYPDEEAEDSIYDASPMGCGCFTDEERMPFLQIAINYIDKKVKEYAI